MGYYYLQYKIRLYINLIIEITLTAGKPSESSEKKRIIIEITLTAGKPSESSENKKDNNC